MSTEIQEFNSTVDRMPQVFGSKYIINRTSNNTVFFFFSSNVFHWSFQVEERIWPPAGIKGFHGAARTVCDWLLQHTAFFHVHYFGDALPYLPSTEATCDVLVWGNSVMGTKKLINSCQSEHLEWGLIQPQGVPVK